MNTESCDSSVTTILWLFNRLTLLQYSIHISIEIYQLLLWTWNDKKLLFLDDLSYQLKSSRKRTLSFQASILLHTNQGDNNLICASTTNVLPKICPNPNQESHWEAGFMINQLLKSDLCEYLFWYGRAWVNHRSIQPGSDRVVGERNSGSKHHTLHLLE